MYRKIYILLSFFSPREFYKIEVKVNQGKILGTREATLFDGRLYFAFYRVPYAEPPIKKLRFKDPVPLKNWNTTLDARTEYHGACAQSHIVHKHGLYGVEDCLYMNIYTPHLPKNENMLLKPVVVWIHGYAFTSSFSHIHGADFLLENDVLVVTVSHRISVFGFIKLNDTDSNINMGLKDIIVALKWIRKNIKHFGGDKKKITLMSSSSAATFSSLLLLSESRKLFSKLILQSGSIFSPSIFQGDYKLERDRLISNLKKKRLNLKSASTKNIIMASLKIYNSNEMKIFQKPVVPFTPIIEKISNESILRETPEIFYNHNRDANIDKSVLVGLNTQESISEVVPFIHNPPLLKTFGAPFRYLVPFSDGCNINVTSRKYKIISNKIKKWYFKGHISEKSLDSLLRYTSDLMKYPIVKFIKTLLSVSNSRTYVYKFDYKGRFNAVKTTSLGDSNMKLRGAANGDEICYILKCEPLWEVYVKLKQDGDSNDKSFIKEISQLWANFAKYGDPTPLNYYGNITWPAMTTEQDNILFIGKSLKLINFNVEHTMYKFWNNIYETFYKNDTCYRNHDEL